MTCNGCDNQPTYSRRGRQSGWSGNTGPLPPSSTGVGGGAQMAAYGGRGFGSSERARNARRRGEWPHGLLMLGALALVVYFLWRR